MKTDYNIFLTEFTTIKNIGFSLFEAHVFSFIICGFILLLGMIGAIAFTLKSFKLQNEASFKQQKTYLQILRVADNSIVFSYTKNSGVKRFK